jgi:hypothetical protein
MASYTGSHAITAGDTYVLMGCDVWTASDLPFQYTGTNNGPSLITIGGEDKTWYNTTNCPSGWNRPVFSNSGHTYLANTNCKNDGSTGQNQVFLCITTAPPGSGYWVVDNIEWMGLTCTGSCTGTQAYVWEPACANCQITNNYFHGLNVAYDNAGNCTLIKSYSGPSNSGTVYQYNIFDGSDRTNPSSGGQCDAFYGVYGNGALVDGNVIHDLTNGIVVYAGSGNTTTYSRNEIYNALSTNGDNHCNLMEIVGGGTLYIHDNILHDMVCGGGEMLMLGNTGETSYIWNNLIYNYNGNGQGPDFPQTGGQNPINGLYFWNNTIVTGGNGSCFKSSGQSGGVITTLVIQNNHCITTAGSVVGSLTGITITTETSQNNVLMTPTTASSQGYTSSETYAYSAVASTNSTVGAGTNLNGSCSGSLASLRSDTTYACAYNSTAQTVTCPGRKTNARPSTGAWDAGAYFYGGDPPPNPPTGLSAVVH